MKDFKDFNVELDEAIDKEHPIVKEYDSLKKNHDIKSLRGLIKGQHRIVDTSEYKTKDHAISAYLRTKHGNKKVDHAFGFNKEEAELGEASNDYFARRKREEDIISGKKPARKKTPAQTSDYQNRRDKMKEEALSEGANQHKVSVTVSEKDHPMVSKRLEKQQKRVIVTAADKDEAVSKAKKFYTKQGYHVHDTEYLSVQSKSSLKTEETISSFKQFIE